MHYLGFSDGELDNKSMLRAVDHIEKIIREIITDHDQPISVELISMDLNGISGHIDHIVAARAAHQVFYRLKQEGLALDRLRLACIPRDATGDEPNLDFVFMEPGRLPQEIDETIDNREYLDEIHTIMRTHYTQRHDGEGHISERGDQVAIDHFIVKA